MSSSSGSIAISIPNHCVGLVLIYDEESPFYLEIPLDTIKSLCLKPLKYLHYLGWSILGVEGTLALESGGDEIGTDGDLDNGGIYYYITDTDSFQAVDLEVIKMRTNVPSETTQSRNQFRNNLLERDVFCVWTGAAPDVGAGLHIIPFQRGSEWFQLIVNNRPNCSEDVEDLDNINDIRNGVFANCMIHNLFDSRRIAILKTPNRYLNTKDIPPCNERPNMATSVTYPKNSRYTLHWLNPDLPTQAMIPDNRDATFKKRTKKAKPSDLLLHYNYGAAAVKWWGNGKGTLQKLAQPPRPPVPVPSPSGPSRTTHDRNTAISKRDAARAAGRSGTGNATAGPSTGEGRLVDSEDQAIWDEDDVMLFFWGSSRAARERHGKKHARERVCHNSKSITPSLRTCAWSPSSVKLLYIYAFSFSKSGWPVSYT
ncbi:hypothetical protein BU17DRAFT_78499 [Hysterangium stoloniferum]|nr:hypothetical protein BU17DRAFT_78499 [Hysterangium stoloniferum]